MVTTLMVANLPIFATQQELLKEINRSGFAGEYDFVYLPRDFEDGSGKGYAFINFKSPETAASFAIMWHCSKRLGAEDQAGDVLRLKVSEAILQGLQANLSKWTSARLTRVRNPEFLPFVLRDPEPEPQAPGPEPLGPGATAALMPR